VGRQQQPVAYFDMNLRTGVRLDRVHSMINDVVQRIGISRCGQIDMILPDSDGCYFLVFYRREAADQFERLYRQTGRTPHRLRQLPDDIVVISIEEILSIVLCERLAFLRYMRSRLN
jgi:hypothetical protein